MEQVRRRVNPTTPPRAVEPSAARRALSLFALGNQGEECGKDRVAFGHQRGGE